MNIRQIVNWLNGACLMPADIYWAIMHYLVAQTTAAPANS